MGKQVSKRSKSATVNKKYQKGGKKISKSGASTNPDRKLTDKQKSGPSQLRTKAQINLLNMYKEKPDYVKMREQSTKPARVEPDRKWFGNIRTIDQKSLEKFRIEMAQRQNDPKSVLIKANKLPMSLLTDPAKENKIKILDIEKYGEVFGPKQQRKRVKVNFSSLDEMAQTVDEQATGYTTQNDRNLRKNGMMMEERDENRDRRMEAGQSKRIWEELYKVLDSSDVVVQVIDARDPMGTRSKFVEEHLKKNCPHKHMVIIMNKCDLVPTWVTAKWVRYLSKEYPTLAFHASVNNSFGKGSLINLLRQYDNFHKDKKTISVGFIGYPNVGKSSVINTLKHKMVCKSAPIPGETKVWQYIHLTRRIYLIDCPGIVYEKEGKSDVEVVLKGCVRAERIDDPLYYIEEILNRSKKSQMKKIYSIEDDWVDTEDFLKQIAVKKGRLLKGGEADTLTVAKGVLMDWQRGVIPFFNFPPDYIHKDEQTEEDKKQIQQEIQDLQKQLKEKEIIPLEDMDKEDIDALVGEDEEEEENSNEN